MSITKNNPVGTYAVDHDNSNHTRSSHETAKISIAGASSTRQNLFYIINTLFFTIIAFFAGYNLKGWQIQKSVNKSIIAAEKYIQKANESQLLSNQLLEELKSYEIKHYDGHISQTAVTPELKNDTKIQDNISSTFVKAEHKTLLASLPPADKRYRNNTVKPVRNDIPGINIYHTVQKGDALSMLVEREDMDNFLNRNPQIRNPDLIYPGQKLLIKIPDRSIQTGAYMNNYFVQPESLSSGGITYRLVKWLTIPGTDSLLGHIMKKPRQKIYQATIPYINLAEFANTMKEEIFNGDIVILSGKNKINRVKKTHTGIYFKTVKDHPLFAENLFPGVHLQSETDYYKTLDTLKDFLIRYLAYVKSENERNAFFHFMVFDRTIVQTDYLESSYFNNNGNKTKILIGLAYPTDNSDRTLVELQSSLTTCKIETGEMAEINTQTFKKFQTK